ncbi:MAG: hypothetical protein LKJ69_08030 [Lactobacillus sp.]|jgi:hypothetical protein|nr:hypothetical protein [Lactobacillus sp.]MCI2033340.1 hypothetical protein [Lactobacillus sp.]
MKFKAMLKLMVRWIAVVDVLTIGALFLIEVLAPLLSGSHTATNDWSFMSIIIGFMGGVMLVSTYIGAGFQLGVSRHTMVRAYAAALLFQSVLQATIALVLNQIALAIGVQTQAIGAVFTGFSGQGLALVLIGWAYVAVLTMAGGGVGLLFGLMICYTTRRPIIILTIILCGLLPMVTMLGSMLAWWGVTSLWPAAKSWPEYLNQHAWLIVGLVGLLACAVLLIVRTLYLRLDAPKQVGWRG